MKRIALIPVVALLSACGDTATEPPVQPDPGVSSISQAWGGGGVAKVDVCHRRDSQGYDLITVADVAFPSHVDHGDAAVGDPVPGVAGFVFDANCAPVEACPCFDASDIVGPIIQCVGNLPGENRAWLFTATGDVACSGERCATSGLSCFIVTSNIDLYRSPISAGQNASCQTIILDNCSNLD